MWRGGGQLAYSAESSPPSGWCGAQVDHNTGPPELDRTGQNLEAGVIFKGPFNVAPTTRH